MSIHSRSARRLALASAVVAALLATPVFAAGRAHIDPASRYDPADGFIVGYRSVGFLKADPVSRQRALDAAATATFGRVSAPGLRRARTLSGGGELVAFDRRLARADAERLMRRLALDPEVAYVEPNIRLHADLTPNDTYFSLQTNFSSTGENTYATQAWDTGYRGQGKIIAVVDTGLTSHPDLAANVLAGGYDFISNAVIANDGGGRDADPSDPGDWVTAGYCYAGSPASNSSWHGTHVAGTAAAVTNNGVGVAGMAFSAKILPVRVLGRCGGTLADIADAVTWASGGSVAGVPAVGANKANVINLSLGGAGACGATMQSAIDGAVSRGTVVVVAAGNDNANVSGYTPASCNNVIVVATFSHLGSFYGNKESFSNWGNAVDLGAPGYNIASTWNAGTTTPGAATYAYMSGTSMSTPHVAGVIAMMMSKPSADCLPATCETLIKTNSDLFMGPVQYPIGWGRVNALKAINATP